MMTFSILRVTAASLLVMSAMAVVAPAQEKNLSAEEILAKHLASFGSADAIAKSEDRMASGKAEFFALRPERKGFGNAEFASNGSDLRIIASFNLADYSTERIGLFKDKVTIPFLAQSRRSPLGMFLAADDELLTARLLCGSMLSSWPLYRSSIVGTKFQVDGKKKVGSRDAWVLRVIPRSGLPPDSYIRLYFDDKSFHHIRTVYHLKSARLGFLDISHDRPQAGVTPDGWIRDLATSDRTEMTEDFDDFAADAAGISLPHKYSVLLSVDTSNGTYDFKWEFTIDRYTLANFPVNYFSF